MPFARKPPPYFPWGHAANFLKSLRGVAVPVGLFWLFRWRCVVSVVGFCGSRGLSSGGLVGSVVRSAVARGSSLVVGCCVGADASVVSAAVRSGGAPLLRVFASFGSSGSGALPVSAVGPVGSAVVSGARVSWWSGGRGSARSRLRGRSLALVRFLSRSGGSLVCFLGSRSSRGSLLAVRAAVSLGVPVFVFVCGPFSVPPLVGSGSWFVSRRGSRFGAACFRWVAS